jgi:hypothetical protein
MAARGCNRNSSGTRHIFERDPTWAAWQFLRGSFKTGMFMGESARKLRSKAGERRHSHVVDAFLLAQSGPQLEGVQDGTQTTTHR